MLIRGDRRLAEHLAPIHRKLDTITDWVWRIIEGQEQLMDTEQQIQQVVGSLTTAIEHVKTELDAFIARQSPDVAADFAPVTAAVAALDAELQAAGQTPTATTTAAPV